MKIIQLHEMAAKKICPQCGKSMTGNHYWYKGGWKCKGGAAAATVPSTSPAPTAAAPLAAKPQRGAPTPTPSQPNPQAAAISPASLPPQLPATAIQKRITEWLNKYMGVAPSTVSFDASHKVTVASDVHAAGSMKWDKLPVSFDEVTGDFSVMAGNLKSMVNFPSKVDGDFSITGNDISSLENMPSHIGGSVDIGHNPISSLEGLPTHINGDLVISGTNVKSLRGIHKIVKSIALSFVADAVKLEEGGVGLLAIKNLQRVSLDRNLKGVEDILNKHLSGERDLLVCQEELIDAGFEKYARI